MRRVALVTISWLLLYWETVCLGKVEPFYVIRVSPSDGATNQSRDLSVQLHFSSPFDASTIGPQSLKLLHEDGREVAAVRTADLGGVISLSPESPLEPNASYRIAVTTRLQSIDGVPVQPFTMHFRTGTQLNVAGSRHQLRFKRERLTSQTGLVGVAAGPDGNIYACTWDGKLIRHRLDRESGKVVRVETVHQLDPGRILCIAFDPEATANALTLWVLYDPHAGMDITEQSYRTVLARWQVPAAGDGTMREQVFIRGLPSGDHPVGSIVFGPDGRAYLSQGAMTMNGSGAESGRYETPLSAAVLVADVRSTGFAAGKLPVDVTTEAPTRYDPRKADAPVKVYASGIREAYDLCWHSNGHLYAGVNMNDTAQPTPAHPKLPVLKALYADEPLIRIVAGAYYGHPNPSINRFVVQGGNPTAAKDPWEIDRYPVGTPPEPGFDPRLLIYNLAKVGGESADGCIEYRHAGALQGALLTCFYTSSRAIGAFRFSGDGHRVDEFDYLRDATGTVIRLGAPLDITTDRAGRIYVADFEDSRRADAGNSGGLWLLTPEKDPGAQELCQASACLSRNLSLGFLSLDIPMSSLASRFSTLTLRNLFQGRIYLLAAAGDSLELNRAESSTRPNCF
jgi:hypothetical protein